MLYSPFLLVGDRRLYWLGLAYIRIVLYLSVLEKGLLAFTVEGNSYSNLSKSELSAISNLKLDSKVVVKGGGAKDQQW